MVFMSEMLRLVNYISGMYQADIWIRYWLITGLEKWIRY